MQKINHGKAGAYVDLRYSADHHVFVKIGESASGTLMSEMAEKEVEQSLLRVLARAEDDNDPFVSGERSPRNAHWRLTNGKLLPGAFEGRRGKQELFGLLQRLKTRKLLVEEGRTNASKNKANCWRVTDDGRAYAGVV